MTHRGEAAVARAARLTFLVDAASYFDAFARAALRARRSILVIGWDFDTRTRLWPSPPAGVPGELGPFLRHLLRASPSLEVRVLAWDYSLIYALERELPTPAPDPAARLWLRLDDGHPPGASHHQKLVVLDDAVAFVGGLDLTLRRWDTSAHQGRDERRRDPSGTRYGPFHDLQIAVAGPAAHLLGDVARERWQRATGERLTPIDGGELPWPDGVGADLEDEEVAIARTEPAFGGRPPVREVERELLSAIGAAERLIYVENQYVTAQSIGAALTDSLVQQRGPEVVLVVPGRASGWLEENTMSVLRQRLMARLHAADRHGRLRVYYPTVPPGRTLVNLHDKLLIVDDDHCHVGSANLSNRSMALDTECDVVITARPGRDGARVRTVLRALRHRLLAEHLGIAPTDVAAAEASTGSVLAAIDTLRGGPRTLRELRTRPSLRGELLPDPALIDPLEPLEPSRVITGLLPDAVAEARPRPLLRLGVLIAALLAVAALWHFTPLATWVDVRTLLAGTARLRTNPLAPVATAGIYVLSTLLFVPVTVMIIQTGVVFGPFMGALYGLGAVLVSAAVSYWLGRLFGRDLVQRFVAARLRGLSRPLGRRAIFVVAALRLVPTGPFTLVNAAFGASQVRFRYFMLGTLLGMGPGVLLLTAFGSALAQALVHPTLSVYAVLTLVAAIIIAFGAWLHRRLSARSQVEDAPRE